MIKSFTHLIFCMLLTSTAFSQYSFTNDAPASAVGPAGVVRCSAVEVDAVRKMNTPNIPDIQAFEDWLAPKIEKTRQKMESNPTKSLNVITIPVVVHVLHNGEPIGTGPNITDAQVLSQIQVLNEDFRKIAGSRGDNSHPAGADVELEFVMALSDEAGNATNGINRRNINQAGATRDDLENIIKPATIWDPTKYINMWTLEFAAPDDNLLGYAQFPEASGLAGMPTAAQTANTDGVVIRYNSFGTVDLDDGTFILDAPYELGRTATHEVGHWVGLRHMWGDGVGCNQAVAPPMCSCMQDDFCEDTPNSEKANYSCNGDETSSCEVPATQDMVENYMDYSNDVCMNIFTEDQKVRVHTVMTNSPRRMELGTSCGLLAPAPRVSFVEEFSSVMEGSSCNTKSVTVALQIGEAPTGNATVDLALGGSATEGMTEDFTMATTSVTFPAGSSANQLVTITINEDAEIEDVEELILSISSVSGGGSSAAPFNQSHTLAISNDDFAPLSAGRISNSTVFEEDFAAGLGAWTTTTSESSPVNWVVGNPAGGIIQSAYIAQTALANAYKYDGLTDAFCRLESPTIDASQADNLVLSFDYQCMGETGFDFGTLLYSLDDGASWRNLGNPYSDQLTATSETISLPAVTSGVATLKLGFQWSNDALVELNPPFNVDNIVIKGEVDAPAEVQSDVNTSAPTEQYLGPNDTVHFYDVTTGNMILSVANNSSYDYGCTTIEVDRSRASAGANSVAFWNSNADNELLAQTFRIIPTNNTPPSGADYDVTLYYNNVDIKSWENATGQSRNDIEIVKVKNNPISAVNEQNAGDFTIDVMPTTVGTYNTSRVTATATFSDGFSGFGAGVPGLAVLPIELTRFEGKQRANEVSLNWTTAAEFDNNYFTIEHATDERGFKAIAKIQGAGNSNEALDYQLMHTRPASGKNYYRLRQTDFDGKYTVSDIIVINFEADLALINVYPNPTSSQINISINADSTLPTEVNLYDINGKQIEQIIPTQNTSMDVSSLATGIYYLEMLINGNRIIEKVVVQR